MKDWVKLPVKKNETGLYINNFSIVEAWEHPIQERLAKLVCVNDGLVILEIGYGLGFSTKAVHAYNPKLHILIEAHPEIAKTAKIELHEMTSIVVGFWEEVINLFKDEVFDGVIFDSYPFSAVPYDGTAEGTFEFIKEFIVAGGRILKKGGRLGFLDFSCKIHSTSEFTGIYENEFNALEVISVPLSIPRECTYARGTSGNVIVLTK
jgi:predicted methyltransferase